MAPLKISDLFTSRFLKSADIGDTDVVLTIETVELEVISYGEQSEEKAVVYFDEIVKVLALNKINAMTISRLYGDDTAAWKTKQLTLYTTEVEYKGEPMMGIRIRLRSPGQAPGSSQMEAKQPDLGF